MTEIDTNAKDGIQDVIAKADAPKSKARSKAEAVKAEIAEALLGAPKASAASVETPTEQSPAETLPESDTTASADQPATVDAAPMTPEEPSVDNTKVFAELAYGNWLANNPNASIPQRQEAIKRFTY
jgi:hypothetical protein